MVHARGDKSRYLLDYPDTQNLDTSKWTLLFDRKRKIGPVKLV